MEYSWSFVGPAAVAGGILAALAMVAVMRWLLSADTLRQAHDATGNLLSIVGTLYAVLLGLIVVDAMVRFERAMDEVQDESNCLADIFMLANWFPEPQRDRIRELCRTYANEVVEVEWPLMARGRMSIEARKTALLLAGSLNGVEPVTESQKASFPMLLDQLRELWNLRRDRSNAVQYGIPAVEWVTLLVGAAVTIFFAGLFRVDKAWLQYLLTALAAMVIGLNLYLVSLFGYPFAGELTVSKRPFLLDIGIFEGMYQNAPGEGAAPL